MADKKEEAKRPIVIKKVKKAAHGHHGGAWKVAYADFVTAMMAFFLLLRLLSTTSKAKLEGLAEYFTPTIGVKDAAGIGFKGGLSDSPNGTAKSNTAMPGIVTGRTPQGVVPDNPDYQAKSEANQDANLFKQGQTAIEQTFSQDAAVQQYKDNIHVQQTPEGLRIDIMDSEKYPMYVPGTAKLTEHGQAVLAKMAQLLRKLPNFMTLTGHTDGSPLENRSVDYSNWELSSDRAQTARRYMVSNGIQAEQPKKVTGMADRELLLPSEPRAANNRRVSILMLRGSHILIPETAVPGTTPVNQAPLPQQVPEAVPQPVAVPEKGAQNAPATTPQSQMPSAVTAPEPATPAQAAPQIPPLSVAH